MDVFRLYWWDLAPDRYLEFRISPPERGLLAAMEGQGGGLIDDGDGARFDRFLFWRLLRSDMLLSEFGRTRLERLIENQGTAQKRLEKEFYEEYRAYRLTLYNAIKLQPLPGASERERLRLAQKLLDRLVFVMFTEDMGGRIAFPPNLLRDELKARSLGRFYNPEGTDVWDMLIELFRTMNDGGRIGEDQIHRFNGGLFYPDTTLDALRLPNHLFCKRGQGRNPASIEAEKGTLLYLSATYNFAAEGDAKNAIGLYTLGHIFEQSIVELEVLEARAEQRPSLTLITKRKRDGVYYTPEPIVRRIVEETIGPLLARWRAEAGWGEVDPTREAADAYWERLRRITVVDPAVGSGAFLITALRLLLTEFRLVADTRYRLRYVFNRSDEAELTRHILANNLYGVDINPLSVEIAQLSLWLHTARAREPLSSFERTIRCGNSLVAPDVYDRPGGDELSEAARARISAFDWHAAFPQVFEAGGFDAVIGNPPYVKLQHFRQPYAETALYLRHGVGGVIDYQSTQTGNFDLFLPFIERGLSLLNEGGRMGYIAPNLWPTLEYGEGLRTLVGAGRHLARWIDFRAHQVFEEATIYTAIQIFTRAPNDALCVAFAPDGDLGAVDWATASAVPYGELATNGSAWLLAPEPVRRLFARLARDCRRLDHPEVTSEIFVGVQTSADWIYHLEWRARGRYLHWPPKIEVNEGGRVKKVQPPAIEFEIEDAIMKPLVSGKEAKRFLEPATGTYLLFPYKVDNDGARLWTLNEMAVQFPKAWAYLQRFEPELRARDGGKNDTDTTWYGYIYPKNLSLQETAKLIVPRLVPALQVAMDPRGRVYCDNVDVGGVVPTNSADLAYIAGVLASPTVAFLFRWLSKPFRGDYLSANKQFIAPLPIPRAGDADKARVGDIARELQRLTTRRRELVAALGDRLRRVARRKRPLEWLLPGVRSKAVIEEGAPRRLPRLDRRTWADARQQEEVEAAFARLDELVRLDSAIEPVFEDGELKLHIDGARALGGIYLDADTGPFALAQWQAAALSFEPTGKGDAKRLVEALRHVGLDAEPALRDQVIERQAELTALTTELRAHEANLHEETCTLFALSPLEQAMIEAKIAR